MPNRARKAGAAVKRGLKLDKAELKKLIKEVKEKKATAISGQERAVVAHCNRQISAYKHSLRRLAPKKTRNKKSD